MFPPRDKKSNLPIYASARHMIADFAVE